MTQSLEILAKATLNTPEFLEFGKTGQWRAGSMLT